MKRYVCWLALLGVGAVPDWASAFHRRCWFGPVYYEPLYYAPPPVVYAPPPMVYAPPPCVPVFVPPPVYVIAPRATKVPKSIDPPKVVEEPKTKSTNTDAIKPAGGIEIPSGNPTPNPLPAAERGPNPAPPSLPGKGDGGLDSSTPGTALPAPPKFDIPKFEPTKPPMPMVEPPSNTTPPPAAPPSPAPAPTLTLPPVTPPTAPPATPPSGASSPLPPLTLPTSPDASMPNIPSPSLPLSPEPKKSMESLPPLVLPPETPVRPPTTVNSSPLSGGKSDVTVQVYAANGSSGANADGLKKVSFFNHTARDLNLTIEGKSVKLPAKTYINARLGASFKWKHSDKATETATIPDDAVGLDVVFKE